MSEPERKKISDLKPGENNVSVEVRVISTREPRVVQTRRGPRTLSEAIVGDETGRIKLTLWGQQAGSVEEGQAIRVEGAWTTAYRGQVQLNVGTRGSISEVPDESVPQPEDIPEETPEAPDDTMRSGGYRRSSGYGRYPRQGRGRRY